MLKVKDAGTNYAILTDGAKPYVLRYDADHLRKYSELFKFPGWTEEKILKELRTDIEVEIMFAFQSELIEDAKKAALLIMPYASANIHDPRKEGAE